MHATTEFDQLTTTLLWATCEGNWMECKVDDESAKRLEEDYEVFCSRLPEWFDPEESCLTGGDPYEQFAHDYILTRMRAGVGFWETSDWEESAGEMLTNLCHKQGTLESHEEDGVVYIF